MYLIILEVTISWSEGLKGGNRVEGVAAYVCVFYLTMLSVALIIYNDLGMINE
jgi:hypothetical protein